MREKEKREYDIVDCIIRLRVGSGGQKYWTSAICK